MASNVKTNKKTFVGVVMSNKMDKSVVVQVMRRIKHPQFEKYINKRTKIMAHDPKNECGIGDTVRISECRPISKRKRWRVLEIVEKAK